jgi:hypothetical protein
MRILFLDIDGPMIPRRSMLMRGNGVGYWGWSFDQSAVSMLNFLGWAFDDLRVVLSSHRWGVECPLEGHSTETQGFWEEIFKRNNLQLRFHEDWITPRERKFGNKSVEVHEWLRLHPEVKTYAMVEDDLNRGMGPATPTQCEYYHLCAEDPDDGLTWQEFVKLAKYLGFESKYKLEEAMAEYSEKVLPRDDVGTEFIP